MNRYEAEFMNLAVVEEYLMNAATTLHIAAKRLHGHGELDAKIQGTLGALEEATALADKAKRLMLAEWRNSLGRKVAA